MGDRLISSDALKAKAFGRCKGLVHVADIDAAPTVPAIPVEWLEWRIAHAEREGFGATVSMLRTVRDWWNDQRDVWEREQEAR